MGDAYLDQKYLEEIKAELNKYSDGSMAPGLDDVLLECDAVVVRSILGAFGLIALQDKVGGQVTTIHNFQKGITATDADLLAYGFFKEEYSVDKHRSAYNSRQVKERKQIIKSDDPIISGYTGALLPHDGRAQLEHIVPVAEIESMPENFLFMDQQGRVDLAYMKDNLTMIESNINQSKSDIPLKEWLIKTKKGQENSERFGIDVERAIQADEDARDAIRKAQNKAAFHKQGAELLQTGLECAAVMGLREVLAVVLVEFYDEAIVAVKDIMDQHKAGTLDGEGIIEELATALLNIKDRVLERRKDLLHGLLSGASSGFIANFLVFVINNFITTAKNAVVIIRESVYALIRAGRIMTSRDFETQSEKIDACAEVLISSTTICLTALLSDAISKYLSGVPCGAEISQALSGILVGVTIVFVTYYFQSIQAELIAATAAVGSSSVALIEAADAVERSNKNSQRRRAALKEKSAALKNLKF